MLGATGGILRAGSGGSGGGFSRLSASERAVSLGVEQALGPRRVSAQTPPQPRGGCTRLSVHQDILLMHSCWKRWNLTQPTQVGVFAVCSTKPLWSTNRRAGAAGRGTVQPPPQHRSGRQHEWCACLLFASCITAAPASCKCTFITCIPLKSGTFNSVPRPDRLLCAAALPPLNAAQPLPVEAMQRHNSAGIQRRGSAGGVSMRSADSSEGVRLDSIMSISQRRPSGLDPPLARLERYVSPPRLLFPTLGLFAVICGLL